MNNHIKIACGIVLLAVSGIGMAEESIWKSQAELGFVNTSGNTETSTVNAKAHATLEKEIWRHNVHAELLNTSSANVTSAEKYLASAQSDYKFNDTDYAFGLVSLEKNRFSGFDYQATLTGGYGKRVLSATDMTLDLEVGPGVRFLKGTVSQQTDNDPFLRLAAKYAWKLSATANLTEVLSSEIGDELTVTKSVTSLAANINATLAMKITFTVKNTSDVPLGNEKTDTETAVTLIYSF